MGCSFEKNDLPLDPVTKEKQSESVINLVYMMVAGVFTWQSTVKVMFAPAVSMVTRPCWAAWLSCRDLTLYMMSFPPLGFSCQHGRAVHVLHVNVCQATKAVYSFLACVVADGFPILCASFESSPHRSLCHSFFVVICNPNKKKERGKFPVCH